MSDSSPDEPRVYTDATARVGRSNEQVTAASPAFPYVKEDVDVENQFIIPETEFVYEGELVKVFTAIETDFNRDWPDPRMQ